MNDRNSMEAVLVAAYRQQVAPYTRAVAAAERLTIALCRGEDGPDDRAQLLAALGEVAALDAAVAGVKQRWAAASLHPGQPLQAVLNQVAALIEQTTAHVRAAEAAAVVRRDALLPELDAIIRARRMQRAYRGET